MTGEVTVTRLDGTQETLSQGDAVFQGDIVETGADGSIGIIFADESTFSLAEDGRMTLVEMIYDPGAQQDSMSVSLPQGAFTFVSGEIAKSDVDAMRVTTPTATIGIRGSAGGGSSGADGITTFAVMPEADGVTGEFTIQTGGGTITINPALQAVYVPSAAVGAVRHDAPAVGPGLRRRPQRPAECGGADFAGGRRRAQQQAAAEAEAQAAAEAETAAAEAAAVAAGITDIQGAEQLTQAQEAVQAAQSVAETQAGDTPAKATRRRRVIPRPRATRRPKENWQGMADPKASPPGCPVARVIRRGWSMWPPDRRIRGRRGRAMSPVPRAAIQSAARTPPPDRRGPTRSAIPEILATFPVSGIRRERRTSAARPTPWDPGMAATMSSTAAAVSTP